MDEIGSISGSGAWDLTVGSSTLSSSVEDLRHTRETLTKAARTVNQAKLAGVDREVTFSIDPGTRRPVVKVVETDTQEIVAQWPSEYLLRLAQELEQSKRHSA